MTRPARLVIIATAFLCWARALTVMADDAKPLPPPSLGFGVFSFGGGLKYFEIERVRAELQLTNEQRAAIKKLAEQAEKDFKSDRDSLRIFDGRTVNEFMRTLGPLIAKRRKGIEEKLKVILSERQIERVGQIALQLSGPQALASKSLAGSFRLTDEQRNKMRMVMDAGLREDMEYFRTHRESAPQSIAKHRAEMSRDEAKELLEVLSPEQRKRFEELQGPKLALTKDEIRAVVGDPARALFSAQFPDSTGNTIPRTPTGAGGQPNSANPATK